MTVSQPLIFFFTDFGAQGPYLGQMEGVILATAWQARVINLLADAPAADPLHAAYLLDALAARLPPGVVIVGVVDPGVGGDRRALMVESAQRVFLGPDNGLLAPLVNGDKDARVHELTYDPATLSASFHGRDLFAPVAASLVTGQPVPVSPLQRSEIVGVDWPDELAEIIYIDQFGNACTGLKADCLPTSARLRLGNVQVQHARTFSAVEPGGLFWYGNSAGLVEIACNQGEAARRLGLSIGSALEVS